jgi:outer membrane protein assembly factor BamD
MRRMVRFALMVFLAISLAGCSWFKDDEEYVDPYAGRSASDIYEEGQALVADGEAEKAGKVFEELERVHPYSEWAKRAMIQAAAAYYDAQLYEQSRQAALRFLDFFPSDQDAPYAQYIIGMTYYDQIVDVGRDQGATRFALQELEEVSRRYPGSDYAREARLKIDLTRDQLAGKEMTIGRYYLSRHNYVAAINRFKVVLEQYQTTSHAPEALHRLVEAYLSLGVPSEAQTAAAVLGHNYPGSEWYQASYAMMQGADIAPFEDRDSWISRIYRQVITGSIL